MLEDPRRREQVHTPKDQTFKSKFSLSMRRKYLTVIGEENSTQIVASTPKIRLLSLNQPLNIGIKSEDSTFVYL